MASGRLKVLTIGHSYVVGANQAVARAIARRSGIALTLAAPTFHYGDLRRLRLDKYADPHYRIVPLRTRFTHVNHIFFYESHALNRLIRNSGFDVVHAWEEPYTVAGYQVARAVRRTKAKFFFRTAQSLVKRYPWPFGVFERKTLERADGWIAGGNLVYRAMEQKGFDTSHARVITLGVDMNHFRPLLPDMKTAVLRELGLDGPVICFLGRLVRDKGLDILMEALERVTGRWSLLALGSGPYEEKLASWADRHGFTARVRVKLVSHEGVARYLGAADLLVAPSRTMPNWKEQFGRMIIEAFACRVPVIGSDSGEIPFVIGDAGLIVPEKDVERWAQSIEMLLEDESRRRELAVRGYERCLERYDIERVADQYVEYFSELMAG